MSRTIRLSAPTPSKSGTPHSDLLASVAGEEDPGAALDAPVPPPRPPAGTAKARSAPDAPVPPPSPAPARKR
ncbi:hypothetical protein [Hydrogenophaga sp.]|uniref:hypothetical protein n=1 Tax=Hydrogenophaga sp. TaxID=1904254 RepID=UPI003D0C8A41